LNIAYKDGITLFIWNLPPSMAILSNVRYRIALELGVISEMGKPFLISYSIDISGTALMRDE
jgi:hypothetical protein